MQLHTIDIAIIVCYIVLTIGIGLYLYRRAARNLDSYFLGENTMPWYILGISNASGMFDITGTMWLVYLLFVYGLKSVWIPWFWPVFNQIFLMVYLSVWLRRSNVMTGAEWIKTRFGTGRGAILSHIIVVIFALVSVVGFLSYGFKGIGKFAAVFLPWDISPDMYGLMFLSITTIYVVAGGMYSVVVTEILQFIVMTISSFIIGGIAMARVAPETLKQMIPAGWENIFFGWRLNLDWSGMIESVNTKIADDGWELFTIFFMMLLFKGILISMAGPAPNYDMQRILATRNPKEAAKMSGLVSVVLMVPRYFMIAGLTVLALVYFSPELRAMGSDIDFEMILPFAIKNFIPVGLMGILLAGLLAAFMSTFAATVNAAPAYIVNDIYKRFINPNASNRTYILMSYTASFAVVIIGISFGFVAESINTVTQWIVSALWGGYTASNVLKWYWWRLNGYGYFWGMVFGIAAALAIPLIFPDMPPLNAFPIILALSAIGCIIFSLITEPDEEEVLKKFYSTVRPWGFWRPIYEKVIKENPNFQKNTNFKRDMFNIALGIIWQTCLIALPIYVVIKENTSVFVTIAILLISSLILKKNWYDKLEN